MKIYVAPPSHLSRAMFRVAKALERYAPDWVQIVKQQRDADLVVLHVIGLDAQLWKPDTPFAMIQYCDGPQHPYFNPRSWQKMWNDAALVWSYYDLSPYISSLAKFFYAPMGLDQAFIPEPILTDRKLVISSGYVNGPGAEAIEEIALAAHNVGLATVHIGPVPTNLTRTLPSSWKYLYDITDAQLASLYAHARWVSGLRFYEGFELPALEGLACGARPILFDRADMRQWYDGHGVFIPECAGISLIQHLITVFQNPPEPVSPQERAHIITRFSWRTIVNDFWKRLSYQLFEYPAGRCDVGADVPGGGAV